jgi:hypothetical protein
VTGGWIKVYRKVQDHWVFKNPDYFHAWICIIMACNHHPEKVQIKGTLYDCDRGQSLLSLESWVKLFGRRWTIQRVRTFLKMLEADEMIELESIKVSTRLTICNYDEYQDGQQTTNTQTTDNQQTDNKQLTTNKNEKNIKNEEEVKGNSVAALPVAATESPEILNSELGKDFILAQKFILAAKQLPKLSPLSPENYASLRENFTHDQIMEQLAEMENYKKLEKNNANIYLTLNNWLKRVNGKPENAKLVEDMEKAYREFIKKQTEMDAKIDKYDRTSLNNLSDYLVKTVTSKSAEGALKCWEWILTDWNNMDSFMQARIKLTEIEKDIMKIIKTLKDAKANNGNTGQNKKSDTGKRRDIA